MVEITALGAPIKTTYEAENNTNAFTDAEKAKLEGIEAGAQVNTGIPGGTTGQVLVKLSNADFDYGWADVQVTVPPVVVNLEMTQLEPYRIYQRVTLTGGDNNKGQGVVEVPISIDVDAALIEYRLRDAVEAGNPTIKNWTAAGVDVDSAETSVECNNVPAALKWFYLDLRANGDDDQIVLGTNPIGMGALSVLAGQSQAALQFDSLYTLANGTSNQDLGVAISPFARIAGRYQDGAFVELGTTWKPSGLTGADDYNSTFPAKYLSLQIAELGVNCGLIGYCLGGSSIAPFCPGGGETNLRLRENLDRWGGFEIFLWHQGGSDVGQTQAYYQGKLGELFTDMDAHNAARGSDYKVVLCTMATRLSASGSTVNVTNIRKAAAAYALANGHQFIEPHDILLPNNDQVHQGNVGNIELAHHFFRGTTPETDNGATLSTATRAAGSKDIVITVDFPAGATSLVSIGSPAPRFSVFTAGSVASPLALDATTPIVVTTNTITLKLAALPADDVALDVYIFLHPDPDGGTAAANMIYDNHTNGDGITHGRQVIPNHFPVVCDAPVEAVDYDFFDSFDGVNGTNLSAHIADTGETWAALEGSQVLIDGAIRGSSSPSTYMSSYEPQAADYDIVAHIFVKTLVGSQNINVLFRMLDSANYYTMSWIDPAWVIGKRVANAFSNIVFAAGTLVAGETYELKMEVRGTTFTMYVDGVQVLQATNNQLTAAGHPGYRGSGSVPSDTTGIHLLDIELIEL